MPPNGAACAPATRPTISIRAEIAAEFEAKLAERDAEHARQEQERERAREDRLRKIEQEEIEWEEEQDRLAAEEEANKTPEERQRDALLYAMRNWSLEELQRRVDW